MPAIAVAEELKKEYKSDILFITTRKKRDREIISERGFRVKSIFSGKFRRYFSLFNFTDIFLIIFGFFQSLFIILKFKPNVIFSKGGYASLPVVLAGGILRKKILLHESDIVLGLSNKVSSPFVKKIAVSFPLDCYENPNSKMFFTGNPTRNLKHLTGRTDNVILVIGGSQGARKINYAISEILDDLLLNNKIVHLSGDFDFEELNKKRKALEKNKADNYLLFRSIFENKPYEEYLNKAVLVISRAGAGTISEIALFKKPSIIIPLSGHQEKNAEALEKNKASIIIKNSNLDAKVLKEKIEEILGNEKLQNELSNNIAHFSSKEATSLISSEIIKLG